MKSIPHDVYLRYLEGDVHEDILKFHNKGNFTLHKTTTHLSTLHNLSLHQLKTLSGNELSLNPDTTGVINEDNISAVPEKHPLRRNRSCEKFRNGLIDFRTIKRLFGPIVARGDDIYNRGYPSGGALYPIEIFCCRLAEDRTNWPCASHVIHVLPQSRNFEEVLQTTTIEHLTDALLYKATIGTPYLAIVYVAYLPKTIFKYRYRGYRMALMETGSIYTSVDLRCKELGLQNRVWSGYSDHMLAKALGLNPALFFPLCVQFVGR